MPFGKGISAGVTLATGATALVLPFGTGTDYGVSLGAGFFFFWVLAGLTKTSVSAKFMSALSMAVLVLPAMLTALVRPVVAAMMAASVQNVVLICSYCRCMWLSACLTKICKLWFDF